MMKVQEVAKNLKVSPACVYQLVSEGRLECFRIGVGRGTLRFSDDQISRFLEGCRVEAATSTRIRPRDIQYRGLSG